MTQPNFQKTLAAFIIFTVFISGCESLGLGGSGQQSTIKTTTRSGTSGVEFSFLPERPQGTYIVSRDAKTFGTIIVAFNVENKGFANIAKDSAAIAINYDTLYFTFDKNSEKLEDLAGLSATRSQGDKTTIFFMGSIKPLVTEQKKDNTISAQLCYPYTTDANIDVCIDTDPGNTKPLRKACTLIESNRKTNSVPSQGAPIAVTQVQQTSGKDSGDNLGLDFVIRLQNQGIGKAYSPSVSALSLCAANSDSKSVNKVDTANKVKIRVMLAGEEIKCDTDSDDKTVLVKEGSDRIVTCHAIQEGVTDNTPSYQSTLQVHLEYNYVSTSSVSVTLKRAGVA